MSTDEESRQGTPDPTQEHGNEGKLPSTGGGTPDKLMFRHLAASNRPVYRVPAGDQKRMDAAA